jgi:hypothetical protein
MWKQLHLQCPPFKLLPSFLCYTFNLIPLKQIKLFSLFQADIWLFAIMTNYIISTKNVFFKIQQSNQHVITTPDILKLGNLKLHFHPFLSSSYHNSGIFEFSKSLI